MARLVFERHFPSSKPLAVSIDNKMSHVGKKSIESESVTLLGKHLRRPLCNSAKRIHRKFYCVLVPHLVTRQKVKTKAVRVTKMTKNRRKPKSDKSKNPLQKNLEPKRKDLRHQVLCQNDLV